MFRPPYGRKSPARHRKFFRKKRRHSLILDSLLAIIILTAISFFISYIPSTPPPDKKPSGQEWSGIAKVIDGDTIILKNQRLRLKGIDAPEIKQFCRVAEEDKACGITAKRALQQKINHQLIHCFSEARDQYHRLLAICYLGKTDLNQWLVEEGYAVSYYDYPVQEREARLNNRGIWAGEFERPQDWRRKNNQLPTATTTADRPLNFENFIHLVKQAYARLFNSGETDE